MISCDIVSVEAGYQPSYHAGVYNKMNINVSPNPLGTVYATKRRRRSNKRYNGPPPPPKSKRDTGPLVFESREGFSKCYTRILGLITTLVMDNTSHFENTIQTVTNNNNHTAQKKAL